MRESTILALPSTIVCVLSFLAQHSCFVEGTEPDVEAAVKGHYLERSVLQFVEFLKNLYCNF